VTILTNYEMGFNSAKETPAFRFFYKRDPKTRGMEIISTMEK
jgi:hypothetical protein